MCTVHFVRCTARCVLCTVYGVLCTVYCELCSVNFVPCTAYCALSTVTCANVYCVLPRELTSTNVCWARSGCRVGRRELGARRRVGDASPATRESGIAWPGPHRTHPRARAVDREGGGPRAPHGARRTRTRWMMRRVRGVLSALRLEALEELTRTYCLAR